MERRTALAKISGFTAACLWPPLFLPTEGFSWGAVQGSAPTHQYIVTQAMHFLRKDPIFGRYNFPSAQQITSRDFVKLSTTFVKSGPGPDMDGNSDYSWHYYNPFLPNKKDRGLGPRKASDCFNDFIFARVNNKDQLFPAAWGAHFLADMFVPYHTTGIPATEAFQRNARRQYVLNRNICDNWRIMYGSGKLPPAGWGANHNHTWDIQRFCEINPLNGPQRADWFDPWYWNGYGTGGPGIVTGSHGSWEYWLWKNNQLRSFNIDTNAVLEVSKYDREWQNRKAYFKDTNYWTQQKYAVENFAIKCATRTRKNMLNLIRKPTLAVAYAVRGVLTMYRASMTAVYLKYSQEKINKGYQLRLHIYNDHKDEYFNDIDVKMSYKKNGRWVGSVSKFKGSIAPNSSAYMYWNINSGKAHQYKMEVAGLYRTPDLGYYKIEFTTRQMQSTQVETVPDITPNYNCSVPAGAKYFSNEYSEGYLKMINGEEKKVGPYKEWWGDDKKRIRNIECFTKNGGAHGIQTFYKKDGSIGSQYLYNNGYYVKEIKH